MSEPRRRESRNRRSLKLTKQRMGQTGIDGGTNQRRQRKMEVETDELGVNALAATVLCQKGGILTRRWLTGKKESIQ